ncbi:hypothetical protein ABID95_007637 [Streptomyces atratus]
MRPGDNEQGREATAVVLDEYGAGRLALLETTWSIGPLIDNPGTSVVKLHWRNCPAPLLGQVKLATWTMINGQKRPTYLQTRGAQARSRSGGPDRVATCLGWMRLARWLGRLRLPSVPGWM